MKLVYELDITGLLGPANLQADVLPTRPRWQLSSSSSFDFGPSIIIHPCFLSLSFSDVVIVSCVISLLTYLTDMFLRGFRGEGGGVVAMIASIYLAPLLNSLAVFHFRLLMEVNDVPRGS